MAPVNVRFESGDRFEFNWNPHGETLLVPFEVAPGVVIPPGALRFHTLAPGSANQRTSSSAVWNYNVVRNLPRCRWVGFNWSNPWLVRSRAASIQQT
jgi:hypothetical protein